MGVEEFFWELEFAIRVLHILVGNTQPSQMQKTFFVAFSGIAKPPALFGLPEKYILGQRWEMGEGQSTFD